MQPKVHQERVYFRARFTALVDALCHEFELVETKLRLGPATLAQAENHLHQMQAAFIGVIDKLEPPAPPEAPATNAAHLSGVMQQARGYLIGIVDWMAARKCPINLVEISDHRDAAVLIDANWQRSPVFRRSDASKIADALQALPAGAVHTQVYSGLNAMGQMAKAKAAQKWPKVDSWDTQTEILWHEVEKNCSGTTESHRRVARALRWILASPNGRFFWSCKFESGRITLTDYDRDDDVLDIHEADFPCVRAMLEKKRKEYPHVVDVLLPRPVTSEA